LNSESINFKSLAILLTHVSVKCKQFKNLFC
jgi:hypothetical protein